MTGTTTKLSLIRWMLSRQPGQPNTKPNLTMVKLSKLEWTPGDMFHTLPRTLNGKVLPPLLKTQMTGTTTGLSLIRWMLSKQPGKPNIKPNLTGVKPSKPEWTPGDIFLTSLRTPNGRMLNPCE